MRRADRYETLIPPPTPQPSRLRRDHFGWRIYAEALMRGLDRAHKVVVITDGARYNKSIIEEHFPEATHIIDLYHAREHLYDLSKLLLSEKDRTVHETRWLELLDEGRIEDLAHAIKHHLPHHGQRRREALREIEYFLNNAEQMRYAEFKKPRLWRGLSARESSRPDAAR